MIRQKTDSSDSEAIAKFCLQNNPLLWSPKPLEIKELHEVNVENFKNAKQFAAFAGVTPSHYESGTSVRGRSRISRMGSNKVRKIVYMAAIVVKNHNHFFRPFCDRLAQKNKPPKVIIVAVMRKLMHIFYGILKNNQHFDEKLAFSD